MATEPAQRPTGCLSEIRHRPRRLLLCFASSSLARVRRCTRGDGVAPAPGIPTDTVLIHLSFLVYRHGLLLAGEREPGRNSSLQHPPSPREIYMKRPAALLVHRIVSSWWAGVALPPVGLVCGGAAWYCRIIVCCPNGEALDQIMMLRVCRASIHDPARIYETGPQAWYERDCALHVTHRDVQLSREN